MKKKIQRSTHLREFDWPKAHTSSTCYPTYVSLCLSLYTPDVFTVSFTSRQHSRIINFTWVVFTSIIYIFPVVLSCLRNKKNCRPLKNKFNDFRIQKQKSQYLAEFDKPRTCSKRTADKSYQTFGGVPLLYYNPAPRTEKNCFGDHPFAVSFLLPLFIKNFVCTYFILLSLTN